MLDAYVASTYCTYYMTSIENKITLTFKHIWDDQEKIDEYVTQMIGMLGNAMLNLQQMSMQQAIYIVLWFPFNNSNRKCVIINTSSKERWAFILKRPKKFQQKPNN